MPNEPSTKSGAQAAEAVKSAAVSLEGMTEEQRQANKLQVERNLAGLQERVHKYNAYLPSLGARAARRKAKLGPNDILMWNYITAQHRAMDAKAVAAMRLRAEDQAKEKAAPEGTAQNPHAPQGLSDLPSS